MLQVQAVFPLHFFFLGLLAYFERGFTPHFFFFRFFFNISSVVVNESINSNFIALVPKTGIHYVHCTNLEPSTV